MMTRRDAREQVGVPDTDRPDPLERAAVGDDEEVVVGGRIRVGPDALDARQEVVERRRRVGRHDVRGPARAARRAARSRAMPRACRRRGSRGRRPAPAARARSRSTTASGTASSVGRRGRRSSRASRVAGPAPVRCAVASAPRLRPAGTAGGGSSVQVALVRAAARRASAAARRSALGRLGPAPASSSLSSCRTRVPRSAVSSSRTCRSGIRLRRRRLPELVADERHRPAEGGDGRVALGGLADDAHPDLGVAQVAASSRRS